MQFEGALIKEQSVTFAIVVVKPHVLDNSTQIHEARTAFQPYFPGVPIILVAQNLRGIPTYQGRLDIVRFLSRVHLSQIPFKKYAVN
jgi:hypothetical protein